ncbi:uncharacterized protein LOC126330067 [Schistocerca gregaria]|uniref:uncharacterized protein LOC126330067 n=1 Tax=Schistocerca gregaria TaxID=7010 RepID=UPI00211EF432|nr:uncharacterized protein LOC126330067 [Schistocerca gregaria]
MSSQKIYPNFEALKLNATDDLPYPLSIDSSVINRSDEVIKTLTSPEKRPSEVLSYLQRQSECIQSMKSLINKQLQFLQVEEIILRNKLKQIPQKGAQNVQFNEETTNNAKNLGPLYFDTEMSSLSSSQMCEVVQYSSPSENDKANADDIDLLMLSLDSGLNTELDKSDDDEDDEASNAAIIEMRKLIADHKSKTRP